MEVIIKYGHHPECRASFRSGGPHITWCDPRTDHRTSLLTFLYIPLPKKLTGKLHSSQNKTLIRGESHGLSDELWDKNAIDGRRWDVSAPERKVCNMEIKIVTLVVKGNVKLTVPTDWQNRVNPSRKQKRCSPSCPWSQHQGDTCTSDRDNSQSLDN